LYLVADPNKAPSALAVPEHRQLISRIGRGEVDPTDDPGDYGFGVGEGQQLRCFICDTDRLYEHGGVYFVGH
jgi:hypothetical protein